MSGAAVQVAPAKVNLALRVLSRDANGYHQIETLFQKLALADEVVVRPVDGERTLAVRWDGPPALDLGPAEQNLAWRAAAAFAATTGDATGWAIALTKRIPAGGGLGGGSADAAAVLRALNAASASPLSTEALHRIAASLGADVPFLVQPAPLALGTGYGERLAPLATLPSAPVLLVLPPFGVNTAAAYGAWAAARVQAGGPPPAASYDPFGWSSWAEVAARQENDFEPTVFAAHPDLAAVRQQLSDAGALIARMSGSGSTLFGVWEVGATLPAVKLPAGWAAVETATKHE